MALNVTTRYALLLPALEKIEGSCVIDGELWKPTEETVMHFLGMLQEEKQNSPHATPIMSGVRNWLISETRSAAMGLSQDGMPTRYTH